MPAGDSDEAAIQPLGTNSASSIGIGKYVLKLTFWPSAKPRFRAKAASISMMAVSDPFTESFPWLDKPVHPTNIDW